MNYIMDERELKRAGSLDWQECCEYVNVLGGGNTEVALTALKLFDVIGIAEHLEELFKLIKREITSFSNNNTLAGELVSFHNNTANKADWTSKEKQLVDQLTRKDQIIYKKALQMFMSKLNLD